MSKLKRHPTCCIGRLDTISSVPGTLDPLVDGNNNDAVTQYRLQKAKSKILSAQKNAKANIDFITQEIQKISEESEDLKKTMKDLEFLISSSKCKTIHPKKLSGLCKVKTSLKIELSNVVQLEKRLKQQLYDARIEYRNAKIDDHILNDDMKKFKSKYFSPQFEKSFLEKRMTGQKRLAREFQLKKNAISAREDTITSVANSITAHVLQKLPGEHNLNQKNMRAARFARESVSEYMTRSLRNARKNRAVAQTEAQIRQRRQAQNLSKLKREINEIKNTLSVKSHFRRIHDEEIAAEKEEVKGLLKSQGANPYLAEFLLAIEEKQREIQRKMLVDEQKRLMDMQREYSTVETSKARDEARKSKWTEYWAKKAKDKMMFERKSKMEMYFDLSGEDEEKEDWKAELQDKVTHKVNPHLDRHHSADQVEGEDGDDEEDRTKKRISKQSADRASNELIYPKEEAEIHFKPKRRSIMSSVSSKPRNNQIRPGISGSDKSKMSRASVARDHSASVMGEDKVAFAAGVASLRKAIPLKETQKESLLRMAKTGENTTAILMNGKSVFDFGIVRVGGRKYTMVSVANIGVNPVKLKMSVLNPYGPFSFINSLKAIPKDTFYSLKFKFQPSKPYEESQETVKIEEIGKPDNYIIIKLKGYADEPKEGQVDEEDEEAKEYEVVEE